MPGWGTSSFRRPGELNTTGGVGGNLFRMTRVPVVLARVDCSLGFFRISNLHLFDRSNTFY